MHLAPAWGAERLAVKCTVATKELITGRLNALAHVPVSAAVLGSGHSGTGPAAQRGSWGSARGFRSYLDVEAFPGVSGKF